MKKEQGSATPTGHSGNGRTIIFREKNIFFLLLIISSIFFVFLLNKNTKTLILNFVIHFFHAFRYLNCG